MFELIQAAGTLAEPGAPLAADLASLAYFRDSVSLPVVHWGHRQGTIPTWVLQVYSDEHSQPFTTEPPPL